MSLEASARETIDASLVGAGSGTQADKASNPWAGSGVALRAERLESAHGNPFQARLKSP
jgi:hypothetical protein